MSSASSALERGAEVSAAGAWSCLPEEMRRIAAGRPGSVLLETARFDEPNYRSYLFVDPLRLLIAEELGEIPRVFAGIEAALAEGLHVAGYFGYECGYHFEPTAWVVPSAGNYEGASGLPLIWLGVYREPVVFDHREGRFIGGGLPLESASPRSISGPVVQSVALEMPAAEYGARVRAIQRLIAAGDTYQVNLTSRVNFPLRMPAAEVFAALAGQQPVAYSAFLNVGQQQILSFSPELFFRIDGGKIVTRPMKGTMARGLDSREDAEAAVRLRNDEKNRSEHVMIVDLLRNDLGRIAAMGSVKVDELFTVERYETLLQMTSTISAVLRPRLSFYEIFRGLFPSGSITGAPKVRTMQIIREIEAGPRGPYTGAIGYIAPDRSSTFNVAIRTLVLGDGAASLGVGGAIVADSDPESEYQECLLKASFLTRARAEFQLIETMLWRGGVRLLPLHLRRLEASAGYFSFRFDRAAVEARLLEMTGSLDPAVAYRLRLLLGRDGGITLTADRFEPGAPAGRVRISAEATSSGDVFLRHKTTRRALYDREHAAARAEGFDDVLFLNERGEVTEGAISNVFVEREGRLLTPPLACGVLDGVYRRFLLESRAEAEERVLTLADLRSAEAIYLCNALRGMYEVRLG